ncbi:unnamed protein product [Alopecurus aequalis]
MGLLNDAEVNLGAPPLDWYGFDDDEDEEVGDEEEGEGDEDVAEIEEGVFAAGGAKPVRSLNYTEIEDIMLVRAWSQVGLDAGTGTGKRYWQRIEDSYCKLKTKIGSLISRLFRSLQGRWELIKPACAHWSAAMDQVRTTPPSGCVESDYETYADLRYKDMAGSKGKSFPFKHCWALLQHLDKWKLRDLETAPKKSDMLKMDDSDEQGRNHAKPEGNKKAKERMKMEAEACPMADAYVDACT